MRWEEEKGRHDRMRCNEDGTVSSRSIFQINCMRVSMPSLHDHT